MIPGPDVPVILVGLPRLTKLLLSLIKHQGGTFEHLEHESYKYKQQIRCTSEGRLS